MKKPSGPRPAPIFPAFVRPPTLFGCEPRLLYALAAVCAILVIPAGVMQLRLIPIAVGVVVFVGGVVALIALNKRDPQAFDVWLRSRQYERQYDARARWDRPAPRRRSWR
jgi:type IV secretory pathway TrbD component